MLRFSAELGLVHGIGEIFVGIGTLFITAASSVIGYMIITKTTVSQEILSPLGPTVVFVVLSFVIGHNFMSIYGMAADTIIHCYCMDEEIHERTGGAQHVPPLLRSFLDDHKSKQPTNKVPLT